jgi:hypothetical protein
MLIDVGKPDIYELSIRLWFNKKSLSKNGKAFVVAGARLELTTFGL